MAHKPKRERIAEIVAALVDSSQPLTAYGIAPRIGMSVSNHLRHLLAQAMEMDLIACEDVLMRNGKIAQAYTAHIEAVENNADSEMLNMIYLQTKRDDWFIHSEVPF